ncbi:hypothetical protein MIR68_005641 [Amoeboaphelidium protococcarum]|nr:hypothetical protein MIR68_005641 [Amoeboaphelidium protococcarum]
MLQDQQNVGVSLISRVVELIQLYVDVVVLDQLPGKEEELVKQAVDVHRSVERAGLFSVNEEAQDLSTQSMLCLVVYFIAGYSLTSYGHLLSTTDAQIDEQVRNQTRLNVLNDSKSTVLQGLEWIQSYKLVDDFSLQDLQRSKPANVSREDKIAQFKAKKLLQQQVSDLSALNTSVDEEHRREFIRTKWLKYVTIESCALLQMIDDEIQLIKQKMEDSTDRFQQKQRDGGSVQFSKSSTPQSGPLLSREGKPLRPFVITVRNELQKQVFRPGHNLPTMSIDQYLENERARGNILSQNDSSQDAQKSEQDEDILQYDEAARQKAISWDQFKEDNPKGWGNKGSNIG